MVQPTTLQERLARRGVVSPLPNPWAHTYRSSRSNWGMATTTQQPRGRFHELVSNTPLVTLLVTTVCIVVYVADNIGEFYLNIMEFSIVPYLVIYDLQLYRIITAAFVHGGLM